MSDSSNYTPPKVWTWDSESGGKFSNINRPIAGPTHDKELPVGKHPLQLYSLGTPNGVKVTVLLEELLALGHEGAEYDAFLINILVIFLVTTGPGALLASTNIVAGVSFSIIMSGLGFIIPVLIHSKYIGILWTP